MAKSSGTTRSSTKGSPRGLSRAGGRYVTYTDEDTGETSRVFIRAETAEEKRARIAFEKYEAKQEAQIDKAMAQRDRIAGKIYEYRDKVRELDKQRKALMSDMEDELSRNETPKRRDWYGTRLDRIDSQIDRYRNLYIAENVNYNTADDKIKRLQTELEERRRQYRSR